MISIRNRSFIMSFLLLFCLMLMTGCKNSGNPATAKNGLTHNCERDYVLGNSNFIFEGVEPYIKLPRPADNQKYFAMDFHELYRPLVDFYDESMQKYYSFEDSMAHLATSKYISIEAVYSSNPDVPRLSYIIACVTVNLEQQKVVYLNDLVDVNDEFLQLLKDNKLAKTDKSQELLDEFGDFTNLSECSLEEIREMIEMCFIPTDKENCWDKVSFFLAPGRIWITNIDNLYHSFYIDLNDIEKFLKVERW